MPKDSYYFKHDSNARHDPKIKGVMNKYGIAGYGRYFIILEMLRESSNYRLEDKQYIWEALAREMMCTEAEARSFIQDCVNGFNLFIQEDGFFYSAPFLERMIKLDEIRAKRSRASLTRHSKLEKNQWEE